MVLVLSYNYSKQKHRWRQTNAPPSLRRRWSSAWGIAWCSMIRASPEATGCRHRATTGFVSPWRPPGRQQTKQRCKMCPLCWPLRWPSRCASTIPRASRNGGGPWPSYFIKATKRRHRASTRSDRHQSDMPTPISWVNFIVKLLKKSLSCLNGNRGVTPNWWEAPK